MTRVRENQPIRKVWVPAELKAAAKEYAWQNKKQLSPFVVDIIHSLLESAEHLRGQEIPPASVETISLYIPDEEWDAATRLADSMHTTVGAMVRVELARIVGEAGIPWDVTTTRPRRDRIPEAV